MPTQLFSARSQTAVVYSSSPPLLVTSMKGPTLPYCNVLSRNNLPLVCSQLELRTTTWVSDSDFLQLSTYTNNPSLLQYIIVS